MAEVSQAVLRTARDEGIDLSPPVLSEAEIVTSKDIGQGSAFSLEPAVSQWSNVAEAAGQLEDMYVRGVEAFNEGRYERAVLDFSQVLDQVPVHAMSLHFLAQSEEKLRQQRLSEGDRGKASELLATMRDAHRQGDSARVMDSANQLLEVDRESLEARWYRRHAEARLRGTTSTGTAGGSRPGGGSFPGGAPRPQQSFGLAAPVSSLERAPVSVVAPGISAGRDSSKGLWVLAGVAVLFLTLAGLWLASFGPSPKAVSADRDPIALPTVRPSIFDNVDDDGTVVLSVPQPPAESRSASTPAGTFSIERVIPTSVARGQPTTLGMFGVGFSETALVEIGEGTGEIVGQEVKSTTLIEVVVRADGARLQLVVRDHGEKATVGVEVR